MTLPDTSPAFEAIYHAEHARLLRYLSEAYRALRHSVPERFVTEELEDLVEWLGEVIRLTDREQDIMLLFATRAGDTIPRQELIGNDTEVGERTIDVQINRLRRKIEDDPANPVWLQTVRGIGYRLSMD